MDKDRFCFDTLARLWEEDPAQFEEYRRSAISTYFDSLGETVDRHRLEQLQFQIDGIIRRHSTMGALVRLHQQMLDEVIVLQDCFRYTTMPQRYQSDGAIPDNVVRFPSPRSQAHILDDSLSWFVIEGRYYSEYADTWPVASNAIREGRSSNRRVNLVVHMADG